MGRTLHINERPTRSSMLLSASQWHSITTALGLSTREFEIVQGIFDGENESMIARDLGISAHTVHTHIKRLYRKLDVRNHAELIVRIFAAYISLQDQKAALTRQPQLPP